LQPWCRRLQSSKTEYCGFICAAAMEDIQKVLDEIKQFSEYNPEFAHTMLDKVIAAVNNTRAELAPMNE
jgi:hypothetical protein